MKVDIIAGTVGGGGGAPSNIAKRVIALTARGIDVKVFGFKPRGVHDFSNLPPNIKFIAKSSGSSIIDSIMLFLVSPFLGLRRKSITHTFRIIRALPFLYRKPITCEVDAQETEVMKMRHSRLLIFFYNLIERICIRRIERIVVTDAGTCQYLERKHSIAKGKIKIIPVGIDLRDFRPDLEPIPLFRYGITNEGPVLLFVGSLMPVKNIDMLFAAFAQVLERYADCVLLIVGDGPENEKLRKLANTLGISDKVFFAGLINHENIPRFMNSADVFVLPSLNEGSPYVVKEAIACALPIVSTNVGDISSYTKDGINGYLVASFDPSEFATAIIKAIENKENLRKGCLETREELSVERMAQKYEDFFCEVMKDD
jgi:glycosyltransferase involved in cell wall biosynthesis